MPSITVAHNPRLTPETAMEIFRKHFKGRYEIHKTRAMINRQFAVRKNGFVGVFVGLEQDEDSTCFVFHGDSQSVMANILGGVLLGILLIPILRPRRKAMEAEIKSFMENEPEFKAPPHLPAVARRKRIVKKRLKSPHQRPLKT